MDAWMPTPELGSKRLELEPLRVEHAEELQPLLDDPALHTYIGGEPPTLAQLRERYGFQAVGHSPDGSQSWLNWILRRRDSRAVVGYVQASVEPAGVERAGVERAGVDPDAGRTRAEVAWVIGSAAQGRGYAKEATQTVVTWLRQHGVDVVIAHVHPEHRASQEVARSAGLAPTDTIVDGETRWQG
jgi:RimJ/RimL family protein N-acetyltransferase